ncbi:MAG: hypothetical protein WBF88_02115 [Pusillimonas sp.]
MKKTTFAYTAKLASLTAAMALCGAAYAATGTAAGASAGATQEVAESSQAQPGKHMHKKGPHQHRPGKRHMHDAAMWVPGYGPLNKAAVESLALNESQIKLVEEARAEQKAGRGERRDAMKSARAARTEQLKSGKLDPQGALKQRDEGFQKAQAERRKIDEKWLAVWSGLDANQQQKVAAHFNERAEKFAKHAEKRKEHRAKSRTEPSAS